MPPSCLILVFAGKPTTQTQIQAGNQTKVLVHLWDWDWDWDWDWEHCLRIHCLCVRIPFLVRSHCVRFAFALRPMTSTELERTAMPSLSSMRLLLFLLRTENSSTLQQSPKRTLEGQHQRLPAVLELSRTQVDRPACGPTESALPSCNTHPSAGGRPCPRPRTGAAWRWRNRRYGMGNNSFAAFVLKLPNK